MCETCAEMPEFCSSSAQCDFCFLLDPVAGGKQSCAEVDPSIRAQCEEQCAPYERCGKGCVPHCEPEKCDEIEVKDCIATCPYDDCRPYQSNGDPADPSKCPSDCKDTCSLSLIHI